MIVKDSNPPQFIVRDGRGALEVCCSKAELRTWLWGRDVRLCSIRPIGSATKVAVVVDSADVDVVSDVFESIRGEMLVAQRKATYLVRGEEPPRTNRLEIAAFVAICFVMLASGYAAGALSWFLFSIR